MANILALETSSPLLSVALQKGKNPIREVCLEGFLSHAENLLPSIDKLLTQEKLKIDQIDTLLIGRGPGSFTGLRIGYASLKGLLMTKKRACYGATSLDLIAEGITLPKNSDLCVCLDARRGKLYTRFYQRKDRQWVSQQDPRVMDFEEVFENLPDEVAMTGDGLQKYGEDFKKLAQNKIIRFLPQSSWYPKASHLIPWFQSRDKRLQKLTKPVEFLPLYFRLSEAEEKRKENAGSCRS